jgi:hypothetical protein
MSTGNKDDWAVAKDLGLVDDPNDELPLVLEPEPEHEPPTEDTDTLGLPQTYPDHNYVTTRVVSLAKSDYLTLQEAVDRYAELRLKYPYWRWIGQLFWTVRHWCWRIDATI